MSLRWVLAVLIVAYGVYSFSSELEFDQLIRENNRAQMQLAAEIQSQLGLTKEKTLKAQTVVKTVSLEGFNLKIFEL
jgi:hypothetical protein